MICLACGSDNVEDVRKAIMEQTKNLVDYTAIQITVATPFESKNRRYDIFECVDCGFLMHFRREGERKELQEITSEDVGLVSEIL